MGKDLVARTRGDQEIPPGHTALKRKWEGNRASEVPLISKGNRELLMQKSRSIHT